MGDKVRYPHILRAVLERPWAIRPDYLGLIVDLVRFRAAGGVLSDTEIRGRIDAAQNGPRAGGGQTGTVAVLPVYGPISARQNLFADTSGGTSLDQLTSAFKGALNDPSIDAIVLEFDSPGGTVDGITELAAEIRAGRSVKPVYAIANTMAASAAYWLATQAEKVFVAPSGTVGAVGVFTAHHDLSAAMEMEGDNVTLIASSVSPYKVEGNQYEPLSDDALANIQAQVDTFGSMFVADVSKGRGVPVETVRQSYGQGRSSLAADALAAGMVDGIATLDDVVRQAARAAVAKKREGAAVATFSGTDIHAAATEAGLSWVGWIEAVTAEIAAEARKRDEIRAEEGRELSEATRASLLTLSDRLRTIAQPPTGEEDAPRDDPEPPAPRGRVHLELFEATSRYRLPATASTGVSA